MGYSLVTLPIVIADIEEAVRFYNAKSNGLGERFYGKCLESFAKIENQPHHYTFVREPVRRVIVNSFPYKIFYYIHGEKVIVLGVAHAKRSNAFVKRRLYRY